MKPLLCVCDLDETLLNSERKISKANEQAILSLQRSGTPITIATGRSHLQIREYIERLEVQIPVITCNGGVTSLPKTEEILHVSYIHPQRAQKITQFCEENHLDYLMYTAKNIFYTNGSKRIEGYQRYNQALLQDTTRNPWFAVPLRNMQDVTTEDYSETIKILVLGDKAMLMQIAEIFNIDQSLTIVSSGVGLIDIMTKSTTKGMAVCHLAQQLSIPMERVAVFGDSPNDISMFQVAGIRVAMGNAVEDVKKLATFVTKTNNESGIAYALSRLFHIPDYSA